MNRTYPRAKYGLDLGTGYEIANNAMRIPFNTGLGYYYGAELGAGLGLDQTAQKRIGAVSAMTSGLASTATFMDSLWKRREAKDRNAYLQSLDYTNQPYDRYGYQSYLGGPSQPNYFKQGGYLPEYQEAGEVEDVSDEELWENYRAMNDYRQNLSQQLQDLEAEREYVNQVRQDIPKQAQSRVGNTRTRTRLPQGYYCNTRSCEVLQDAGAKVARPTKSVRGSGMYQQGEPMPIIPGNQSFLARARDLGFQEVQSPEAGDLVQWLSYPDMTPTHSVIYGGPGAKIDEYPRHDYYSDPGTGNVYKYVNDGKMPGDRKVWRYVGRTPQLEQEYNQLMSQGQQYMNLPQPSSVTIPSLQQRVSYQSPINPDLEYQTTDPLPDVIEPSVEYLNRRMLLRSGRPAKNRAGEMLTREDINLKKGGLIKRADGSYSQRGLWDNIRANIGSGKKPTKQMLEQERKIKKMEEGGTVRNGTTKRSTRQGKKMAVYMDGTWHHFGDSSMDDYRTHKSEKRKEAFYSRHKKNLQGDSPRAKAFRVYARKTWQLGGEVPTIDTSVPLNPIYPVDPNTRTNREIQFKGAFEQMSPMERELYRQRYNGFNSLELLSVPKRGVEVKDFMLPRWGNPITESIEGSDSGLEGYDKWYSPKRWVATEGNFGSNSSTDFSLPETRTSKKYKKGGNYNPNIKPCFKCGGKVKYQEGGDVDFYDSDPEQLYIDHVGDLPQELSVTEFELPAHAAYMKPQDLPRPQMSTAPKGGSIAVTHNNPGNIKFGQFAQEFGATPGRQATDGGIFAVFPDVETGLAAQRRLLLSRNYKSLTVNQAMKRWSNSGYGGELYPSVSNKKMSELTEAELIELQRRQIKREDGNMYRAIYGQ